MQKNLNKEYLILVSGDCSGNEDLIKWLDLQNFFPDVIIVNVDDEPIKCEILMEHCAVESFTFPSMFELVDDCCPEPTLSCSGLDNIKAWLMGAVTNVKG